MTTQFSGDARLQKLFEADAALTAPGQRYEIVEEEVLGVRMGVFKHRHANLRDQLLHGARTYGDADLYVWSDGRRQTFTGLIGEVAEVAAGLRDRYGIGKGSRVAICAANCPEWILTFWACAVLDAVVVAMNGWWTGGEMRNALDVTTPHLLIVDEKRHARLEGGEVAMPVVVIERSWNGIPVVGVTELPDGEIHEDDPIELLFTSGTTGRPKAAILSHRAVIAYIQLQPYGAARGAYLAGLGAPAPQPVRLAVFPLFHVSGLSTIVGGVEHGSKSVWLLGRFDAALAIDLSKREGINMWLGSHAHVMKLLDHPDAATVEPTQIWSVNIGGSATAPHLLDRAEALFPHLVGRTQSGYGSTEAGLIAQATHWMLRAAPDCAGAPYPTVTIRITDDDGDVLANGAHGHVEVRSSQNIPAYWNSPLATEETVRPGAWVRTGDFGRFEDGLIFISSRVRDLIIRGGENVYPFEIENVLDEHPDVVESAVFGIDNIVYGQEVKAVVVVHPDAKVDADELRELCAAQLASYKVPVVLEITHEALPRTASGKVMKHVLGGATNTQIEE
jgi:acyl-CoA synthetase (AMP-forming)/AMP-acid ligase II